jgi:hypothetical protein
MEPSFADQDCLVKVSRCKLEQMKKGAMVHAKLNQQGLGGLLRDRNFTLAAWHSRSSCRVGGAAAVAATRAVGGACTYHFHRTFRF